MPTRTALVTGGTGFIGQRVVERLLEIEYNVVSFSLPGEIGPDSWGSRVDLRVGDITDPSSIETAAQGCDLIIHLAGLVGHGGDYDRQWKIFVDGTRHVCEAAIAHKSRLVVSTSIAAYGENIQTKVCHEEVGHGSWAGAYGRAKQGQENMALELAESNDLNLTIVRPANVYGLGGGGAWGDKLLDSIRLTGGALIGEADTNNAGLVHVDNLADAIVLAGTHPNAINRIYNVCDGEDITWATFMRDMAKLVDRPRPPSFSLSDVLALIRSNEDPARMVGPEDPSLPTMEGINLVGFDNRIPAKRISDELGWKPSTEYADAMKEWKAYFSAS